jgi:CMP-N,N'-diacetyllegionaminic acid synthase
MKVLGIIPARGGSKRVPEKNIRLLNGKPLIQYAIDAANKSVSLLDCIVSTDSAKIASLANQLGGKTPFIRPAELATDNAGDRGVLMHAIQWYEENVTTIDAVCILRPTSPFRTASTIDSMVKNFTAKDFDSQRSVTRVEGVHHPFWMFKKKEGLVVSAVPGISIDDYYQSQLLPPVYRLNGAVDIIRKDVVFNETTPLYGQRMDVLETDSEQALDIDTEQDFEYCEWLMTRME